jgi:glycosyltransferase involved in cell wall biosynthesis
MSDNSTVISIITVVFNDAEQLLKTIQSVAEQSYSHIQYIIVDGGSTDNSVDVIREHESFISQWISEKDEGLYDAMNKGLKMATGDYVWFLNSGDEIYDSHTLENILKDIPGRPGIIYGDTMITDIAGKEVGARRLKSPVQLTWKSFNRGMVVCHQSMLVRKDIAADYNLEYTISSDVDWAIRSARNTKSLHYSKMEFSKFMEGGLSRQNLRTGLKERFKILVKHYGFLPTAIRHVFFGFRLARFYILHRRI